ncbi:hypothetical protein QPK87_28525, partial [Kamptonema cortianum]|nr:hypothetical protein [Kamptonema cortianum]
ALNMFAAQVNVRAAALPLTAEQQATLSAATAQFADAQPPGGLSDEVQAQVTSALQWSFVETYRVLMLICALLAWISAGMAAIFVEPKRTPAAVPAAASGGR